jgi:hypothetical protein
VKQHVVLHLSAKSAQSPLALTALHCF